MNPYKFASVFLTVLFISVLPAAAQECPASVLLSIARAASACMNMERDTACYGGGAAFVDFFSEGGIYEKPGDRLPAGILSWIGVDSNNEEVSLAYLYLQASLPEIEQRSVTLLLVGGAGILNSDSTYAPEILVSALGILNIRREPTRDSEIIARVGIGESVIANGHYSEGGWLRVDVPNSEELGWVALDVG